VTVPKEAGVTDMTPTPATPFRISLTSGTTGIPKGDLLTHGHLTDRVERTLFGCNCDRTSRVMPSDINFTMAIAVCFGVLSLGGTIVFPTSSRPEDRIHALKEHAVTHAFLSQWAITQMLDLLPEPRIAFPALEHLRPVGSLASEALLESLRIRFTPHIFVTYGLTELGPVSMADPETLRRWPRSGGHLLPWVTVEVLGPDGTTLPRGESGEIRVRVDRGATGYHGDALESDRKFRNGWFYTGDHGRVAEDGLIFIEGRIDEMINLAGYKISPVYVEGTLMLHPQVADAVAFVLQEGHSTEILAAAVISRPGGVDMADLSAHAEKHLGWGSPKRFFILSDFPRTPNGKAIRSEMAAAALRSTSCSAR
jgi:acyl-coenzyme A synthetase/AMP-(fatty) acid ligase